jgi:DNA-directed RNA polymerase specialized sigma24 family protein
MADHGATPNIDHEHRRMRDVRASRYSGLLPFVACRVLGDERNAEDAVEKCLLIASEASMHFDSEGAFRSWLVRILIDEALLILKRRQEESLLGEP